MLLPALFSNGPDYFGTSRCGARWGSLPGSTAISCAAEPEVPLAVLKSSSLSMETPMSLVFRVNEAMEISSKDVKALLHQQGFNIVQPFSIVMPETLLLPVCPNPVCDVLSKRDDVTKYPKMVTVGRLCGEAVLSGADVYAPGVAEWPEMRDLQGGQNFYARIFADVTDRILRGGVSVSNRTPACDTHVYLGIGKLLKQSRDEVFGHNASGTAVEMVQRVYSVPSARKMLDVLPAGAALLQTLPSQVVGRIVDPSSEETILDMCAAPGGKTAHMAALMMSQKRHVARTGCGCVTAIARTQRKRSAMEDRLTNLGIDANGKNVLLVTGDALKAENMFGEAAFDKVLLDAPCTGSGTRPRLSRSGVREGGFQSSLSHEVALQRRLLAVASRVVRPDGNVIYSVCSDSWDEGEGIVAWAAAHEARLGLKIVDCWPEGAILDGFARCELSARDSDGVLPHDVAELCVRFSANSLSDDWNVFTGFFVAKFEKSGELTKR
jgi:methyltransferase NSUN6